MRLGTKILLLTLGLVVALTAAVLGVVRERVRSQEVAQTTASIHRAVGEYFSRINAAGDSIQRVAKLLFDDPNTRSDLGVLNSSEATDADKVKPLAQIRDYIIPNVMQKQSITLPSGTVVEPAFHVLFNELGVQLVAWAPDPALAERVKSSPFQWPVGDIVDGDGKRISCYLRVNGRLYLALGIPLSTSAGGENPPPTNAYFVGFEINDKWAAGFLGERDPSGFAAPLGVWFLKAQEPWTEAFGGTAPSSGEKPKWAERTYDEAAGLPLNAEPRQLRVEASIFGTMLAEAVAFEPAKGERMVLAVTASLDDALAPMNRLLRTITLVGVGAVVVAFVACRWIARRIARPIGTLVVESERIGRGEFDVTLDTDRKDELGDLARGFTHMAKGLAQRDFIKDTFGKFVDPSVVATLIADPKRLRPGGEQRVQTVLMSDVANFTRLGEKLTPEQLVLLLNEYLGACADIVANEKGVVDKFIGDAVVAFWGPPLTDDHAERACRAALRMADAAASMNARCAALGVAPLKVRIGIATGEMIVGNIGSPSKFNYTVMGDVVNLCARLEGVNKLYSTTILATRATAQSLGAGWVWRELDVVRVVGRGAGEPIVEIMAAPSPASADTTGKDELRRDRFVAARAHYLRREWPRAREAFEALAREFPADNAAAAMALRCARLEAIPPEPGWDGVWTLDVK